MFTYAFLFLFLLINTKLNDSCVLVLASVFGCYNRSKAVIVFKDGFVLSLETSAMTFF